MNQCLILVDLQNDYFPGGKMELSETEKAANNAKMLLDAFRKTGLPIIHIQHISLRTGAAFFLPDSDGAEIHEAVAPQKGEPVIVKHFPNSFRDTALLDDLKKLEIESLLICGAMSHMCIDSTTRAAFDLGFHCIVAEDACTTRDLTFNGKKVTASEVHASFMAALSVPFAEILTTESILKLKK